MIIDIKFDESGKIIPSQNGLNITIEDSPYLIFLTTVGMCAAVYIRTFIKQRDLTLEGVKIQQFIQKDLSTDMTEQIDLKVDLPISFPKKYKKAIKMVVDQCKVKKHLHNPPEIKVSTSLDVEVVV